MARIIGNTPLPDGGCLLQVNWPETAELRQGHWFRLAMAGTSETLPVLDCSHTEHWIAFHLPPGNDNRGSRLRYGTSCILDGPHGEPLPEAGDQHRLVLACDGTGLSAALFAAIRAGELAPPSLVLAELAGTPPVRLRPSRFLLDGMPPGVIASLAPLEDAGIPSRVSHPDGLPGCHDGGLDALLGEWLSGRRAALRWKDHVHLIGRPAFIGRLEPILRGRVGRHTASPVPAD